MLFIYSPRLLSVTEWNKSSVCFNCNVCLVDWLPQDEPFLEHGYWFPDFVYVRYIKGPSFYRECLKYYKERHHTTDKVETFTPEC